MIKKIAAILLLFILPNISLAANELSVLYDNKKGNNQILFYSSSPAKFEISQKKNELQIKFDQEYQIDIKKRNNIIVQSAQIFANGAAVTFTLDKPNYKVRKIANDSYSGVEISINDEPQVTTSRDKKDTKKNSVLDIKKTTKADVWQFNFSQEVASAFFVHNNKFWLVFDRPTSVNAEQIKNLYKDKNLEITNLSTDQATILKIDKFKNNFNIEKIDNSWIATFTNDTNDKEILNPIKDFMRTDTSLFFAAPDPKEPIYIIDNITGDKLAAIPFAQADTAIASVRSFGFFKLPITKQGMLITKFPEDLAIVTRKDGIEFIPRNELSLPSKPKSSVALPSESPFASDQAKSFMDKRRALEWQSATSNGNDKVMAKYNLAKFYFDNEMFTESQSILNSIKNKDKNAKLPFEVQILSAITNFMIDHFSQSKFDLSSINPDKLTIPQKNELNFWRNIVAFYTSSENSDFSTLDNKAMIDQYPRKVRARLTLDDIEDKLYKNDLLGAEKILSNINNEELTSLEQNSLKYYTGQLKAKEDKSTEAFDLWTDLTTKVEDRLNRARSGYALINMLIKDNKITKQDAIDKLNSLRPIWRGDETESDILKLLGNLYEENGQIAESLRVRKDVITNFPSSGETLMIAAQMGKLFEEMFSQGGYVDNLSDLDAVSLFYEFRELIPIGKIGDIIIQKLVDRLIKLDLLDRASALLEHQMKYRFKDDERIIASNKLAFVYLNDKNPQKALDALAFVDKEPASSNFKVQRALLKAQALIDLNQLDQALATLKATNDNQADFLKASIFWKQNNWKDLNTTLYATLSNPEQLSSIRKADMPIYVLRLVIANANLGDVDTISKIKVQFRDVFEANPRLYDMLDYLHGDQKKLDYKNLENSLGITEVDTFLTNYKKHYLPGAVDESK